MARHSHEERPDGLTVDQIQGRMLAASAAKPVTSPMPQGIRRAIRATKTASLRVPGAASPR